MTGASSAPVSPLHPGANRIAALGRGHVRAVGNGLERQPT
jgi:hypothetical protein